MKILLILLSLPILCLGEDTIKDLSGRTLKGEVFSFRESKVLVRSDKNNKVFTIPIENIKSIDFERSSKSALEAVYPVSDHYKMVSCNGRISTEHGQKITCEFLQIAPLPKSSDLMLAVGVDANGSKNTLKILSGEKEVGSFKGRAFTEQKVPLSLGASKSIKITIVNRGADACRLRSIYQNGSFYVPRLHIRIREKTPDDSKTALLKSDRSPERKKLSKALALGDLAELLEEAQSLQRVVTLISKDRTISVTLSGPTSDLDGLTLLLEPGGKTQENGIRALFAVKLLSNVFPEKTSTMQDIFIQALAKIKDGNKVRISNRDFNAAIFLIGNLVTVTVEPV